jgi:hypothetical protein
MKQLAAHHFRGYAWSEAAGRITVNDAHVGSEFDGYGIPPATSHRNGSGGLQTATFINHMSLAKRKRQPNAQVSKAGVTRTPCSN